MAGATAHTPTRQLLPAPIAWDSATSASFLPPCCSLLVPEATPLRHTAMLGARCCGQGNAAPHTHDSRRNGGRTGAAYYGRSAHHAPRGTHCAHPCPTHPRISTHTALLQTSTALARHVRMPAGLTCHTAASPGAGARPVCRAQPQRHDLCCKHTHPPTHALMPTPPTGVLQPCQGQYRAS
jgi:hypothetical protein